MLSQVLCTKFFLLKQGGKQANEPLGVRLDVCNTRGDANALDRFGTIHLPSPIPATALAFPGYFKPEYSSSFAVEIGKVVYQPSHVVHGW